MSCGIPHIDLNNRNERMWDPWLTAFLPFSIDRSSIWRRQCDDAIERKIRCDTRRNEDLCLTLTLLQAP
jgi:hypothetical protein